jgi:proline iminopeptidase
MAIDDNNFEQFNEGLLDVGQGHQIYYAQHGNPEGIPLVLVHGGPGGQSYASNAGIADLDKYRLIRFDQRGTGKSQYTDQMAGQTIAHQVQDMEALRTHLDIDSWVMLGGSYGTTLSSHYRINYPENISAHFMRAIFFGDKDGAEHIADGGGILHARSMSRDSGAMRMLDKAWLDYISFPNKQGGRYNSMPLLAAYSKLINHSDPEIVKEAGLRFDRMDTAIATAVANTELIESLDATPEESVTLTRLFCHYTQNEFNEYGRERIIAGLQATKKIPTVLIHGKQDYICPVSNAEFVQNNCPNVDVQLVDDAGHSLADAPMLDAVKVALKTYALSI